MSQKRIDYEQVKKEYDPKSSLRVNANKMGISHVALYKYVTRHGLYNVKTRKKKSVVDDNKIIELYNKGLSDHKIAKELDISHRAVFTHRKNLGLPTHNPKTRNPKTRDVLEGFEPTVEDESWEDPESLFCDMGFLEKLVKGDIKEGCL